MPCAHFVAAVLMKSRRCNKISVDALFIIPHDMLHVFEDSSSKNRPAVNWFTSESVHIYCTRTQSQGTTIHPSLGRRLIYVVLSPGHINEAVRVYMKDVMGGADVCVIALRELDP